MTQELEKRALKAVCKQLTRGQDYPALVFSQYVLSRYNLRTDNLIITENGSLLIVEVKSDDYKEQMTAIAQALNYDVHLATETAAEFADACRNHKNAVFSGYSSRERLMRMLLEDGRAKLFDRFQPKCVIVAMNLHEGVVCAVQRLAQTEDSFSAYHLEDDNSGYKLNLAAGTCFATNVPAISTMLKPRRSLRVATRFWDKLVENMLANGLSKLEERKTINGHRAFFRTGIPYLKFEVVANSYELQVNLYARRSFDRSRVAILEVIDLIRTLPEESELFPDIGADQEHWRLQARCEFDRNCEADWPKAASWACGCLVVLADQLRKAVPSEDLLEIR